MALMDHENVVRLYCMCLGEQLMLISQFVPLGSLLNYLKKHHNKLNAETILQFSLQIAKVLFFMHNYQKSNILASFVVINFCLLIFHTQL